jgi:NAD(P)H-flavin reductase
MGWLYYEFLLSLTEEEKHQRRLTLDRYALIAHLSAYVPILVILAVRFVPPLRRLASHISGIHRPVASTSGEDERGSLVTGGSSAGDPAVARFLRRLAWRLGDDVYFGGDASWGQLDQWLIGGAWTLWLLVLCFADTGTDYLHLVKRIGLVAASQLPIQYLLALKPLNPYAWALGASHETANRLHRPLGRIVYGLLVAHAVLYNVFFLGVGVWLRRFFAPVVFAGVVAFVGIHALNGTSLASVRRDSYRIFFVTHLVVAFAVPPLIFFHAPPARPYVLAAIAVFVVDLAARKLLTATAPAIVEAVPGTDLFKVRACLPLAKARAFAARPGSHAYLSIPAGSRPAAASSSMLFEFLFNPFTAAQVNKDTGEITFVIRRHDGPFTSHLASVASTPPPSETAKININVEGPYGAAAKAFSTIGASVDRVLFIAGGVGATFAFDMQRARILYHLQHDLNVTSDKIRLIWAIRSPAEETWVTGPEGGRVHDEEGVHVYVTRDNEVHDAEQLAATELGDLSSSDKYRKRPNVTRIVDDMFRGHDDTVAVLVCGPGDMGKAVRSAVRPWVLRGRRVWYHNEAFGW